MIRFVADEVWAFDAEWVPDRNAGIRLLGLDEKLSDIEVYEKMWQAGGGTEENPRPYLKTVLCRVVSISTLIRSTKDGSVELSLRSLPRDITNQEECSEGKIIQSFLETIGKRKPQLVGFNSMQADIKIMLQRAVVNGVALAEFSKRPAKPWEGADYFARGSDFNIDLMELLGGWGSQSVSLNDLAVLSGIPGKFDTKGEGVVDLSLSGELQKIIAYNEFDALTTYLVWLRVAHTAGCFNYNQYRSEQHLLEEFLLKETNKKPHLSRFIEEWQRVRN